MADQVLNNLEITSMIFQWLKVAALDQANKKVLDDRLPSLPTAWKARFARLATVNRAFFSASIDVLWEQLESSKPLFVYALPADRGSDRRPISTISYQNVKLTPAHWNRFKDYASRVKYLVLEKKTAPVMHSSWIYQTMASNGRPPSLLPRLQHLYLASVDSLSLCIAFNSMAPVTRMRVDFAREKDLSMVTQHARALTTGMMQHAIALTHLNMVDPVGVSVLRNISHIMTLRSLRVTLDHAPQGGEVIALALLNRLPALESLRIDQDRDLDDQEGAKHLPEVSDLQAVVSCEPKFRHLKTLRVTASGATHLDIARTILPGSLGNLTLELRPDRRNVQLFLLPMILALYTLRNPRLVRLTAFTPPYYGLVPTISPERLDVVRSREKLCDTSAFLEGVAALSNLQVLSIFNVPFITVDIVHRLLAKMQRLPHLRTLNLNPISATNLPADQPVGLPLVALEDISQNNPNLTRLEVLIEAPQDIPECPAVPSNHGLKKLGLSSLSIRYGQVGQEDKLKLARYISKLFPQAETIEYDNYMGQTEFWASINQLLASSRDPRNQSTSDGDSIMDIE